MYTEFGLFLHKYRISKQITQRELAIRLGLTPAYLSYLVNGCKHLPLGIEIKIANKLSLSDEQKEEFFKATDKSRKSIDFQIPENEIDQLLLGSLCRRLDTLTAQQKSEITRILYEG